MKEAEIRRQICEYLDQFPTRCLFRINVEDRRRTQSKFLPKGWPDISGSWDSRALYIEVKIPGGKVRLEQYEFMMKAKERGCIAIMATSVEDVQRGLA